MHRGDVYILHPSQSWGPGNPNIPRFDGIAVQLLNPQNGPGVKVLLFDDAKDNAIYTAGQTLGCYEGDLTERIYNARTREGITQWVKHPKWKNVPNAIVPNPKPSITPTSGSLSTAAKKPAKPKTKSVKSPSH